MTAGDSMTVAPWLAGQRAISHSSPAPGRAHYEAAQSSPDRSTLATTWQDPERDMTPKVRQQLGRKGRYLVRNSPLFAGIIERMVTYVVGAGIHPEPVSSDSEYNLRAQAAWDKHKNNLDLDTCFSWDEIVAIIYESILVENGCYSVLTYNNAGEPRIQIIESHRIGGSDWIDPLDGITLGADSRPATYRLLLTRDRAGKATPIEADFIVPHYFPKRPGQLFGLTIFAPAINTVHDIADLLAIEQAAVKDVCQTTKVITTASGEANSAGLVQARYGTTASREQSATSAKEALAFYEQVFGPQTKYVRRGDDFKQFVPERPSPTWVGMMDFLAQLVCMPLGMPPSTLLQIKVGGVDRRSDLATAGRVIERHQRRLAQQLQRIYEHVVESDLGTENRPDDWNATEWQFSAAATADAGRMAQQDREDVAMGTNSVRNLCGANGLGGVEKFFRTRAQDVTLRDRITAEENERRVAMDLPPLLPSQIFNFDYKSQPGDPTPAGQEAQAGAGAAKAPQEGAAA